MTPADFAAWMVHMGLTERSAAVLLGCSPATVGQMRRGISRDSGKPVRIDKRTALACTAPAGQ
jgi:hypothetical protein